MRTSSRKIVMMSFPVSERSVEKLNTVNRKLRSRAGASITFALLLFLVCAVLSSVIIAAATTTSGRMANLAESDQRYYSVTSACEVMKKLIDGKKVTEVTVTKQEVGEDGNIIGSPSEVKYLVSDKDGGEAAGSLSDSSSPPTAATKAAQIFFNKQTESVNITVEGLDADVTPDISETVAENGDITLTVSKKNTGNPYEVQMLFRADVTKDSSTRNETEESDDGSVKIIRTTIDTKTVRWTLSEVKTISNTGAGA